MYSYYVRKKLNMEKSRVKYIPRNIRGRDFCIGDLHGQYDTLLQALSVIKFNKNRDRLFSVGDLIDRGPNSLSCLQLIKEPWFYSVLANHELYFLCEVAPILVPKEFSFEIEKLKNSWITTGGLWYYEEPELREFIPSLAKLVSELPFIIVVDTEFGRRNIVHAELKKHISSAGNLFDISDNDIDNNNFDLDSALFGRERITAYKKQLSLSENISNLSPTLVGHTPRKELTTFEKHYYIDLGCFRTTNLAIVELTSPDLRTIVIS